MEIEYCAFCIIEGTAFDDNKRIKHYTSDPTPLAKTMVRGTSCCGRPAHVRAAMDLASANVVPGK